MKRYDARDAKCGELRSKLSAAKSALSCRERELEASQRQLSKANAERNQLKVCLCVCAHTRARGFALSSAGALQTCVAVVARTLKVCMHGC